MLNTCFPSRAWEPGYVPGKGTYMISAMRTLGIESLMSFSGWHHVTHAVITCDWGN